MQIDRFLSVLPTLYDRFHTPQCQPKDDRFAKALAPLYAKGHAMTSPSICQCLNLAVSLLEEDETYLEIGSYRGATAIGALTNNKGKLGYCVDNFSEFDPKGVGREELFQNWIDAGMLQRVLFFNQDCWKFFEDIELYHKIGAYLYDGKHDYDSQYRGLMEARRLLSDEAIVFVDDLNYESVQKSIVDVCAVEPRYKVELEFKTNNTGETTRRSDWWNGWAILSWKADRA